MGLRGELSNHTGTCTPQVWFSAEAWRQLYHSRNSLQHPRGHCLASLELLLKASSFKEQFASSMSLIPANGLGYKDNWALVGTQGLWFPGLQQGHKRHKSQNHRAQDSKSLLSAYVWAAGASPFQALMETALPLPHPMLLLGHLSPYTAPPLLLHQDPCRPMALLTSLLSGFVSVSLSVPNPPPAPLLITSSSNSCFSRAFLR